MVSSITQELPTLEKSRLYCPLNRTKTELFFSLVDYRNNYFSSDDPDKIIEFYNGFENREQLFRWMKIRPKGIAIIYEVEGDKDIIVVIPTSDFNGKYAKECRENIFKGLHIVFIESGGKGDFYFNYAHNANIGIKKAMAYNPSWIVLSNDDMYKIDDVKILKLELSKIDGADVVYTEPSIYHSTPMKIVMSNRLYYIYLKLFGYGSDYLSVFKRLNIKYLPVGAKFLKNTLLKRVLGYVELQTFMIFSGDFIKREGVRIFDEVFQNHAEDTDLAIRLKVMSFNTYKVNYKIGDYIGSTFGMNYNRQLRSLASLSYFTSKWENKFTESIL